MTDQTNHDHYFLDVSKYNKIDPYRICELAGCSHPAAHIVKKAMFTGKRGHKDLIKDIENIRDTATRWLEMIEEDE